MTKIGFCVRIWGVFLKKIRILYPIFCQNDENGPSYFGDLGQKYQKNRSDFEKKKDVYYKREWQKYNGQSNLFGVGAFRQIWWGLIGKSSFCYIQL